MEGLMKYGRNSLITRGLIVAVLTAGVVFATTELSLARTATYCDAYAKDYADRYSNPGGNVVGGAVGGAALGALFGAIAGAPAAGAGIGAGVGALRGVGSHRLMIGLISTTAHMTGAGVKRRSSLSDRHRRAGALLK